MQRSSSPTGFRLASPRRFLRLGGSDTATRMHRASRAHGRVPAAPSVGQRLSYLPGLDGLRALAVIAVVLYHAGLPFVPGGFLGVEVFFVISGYLITSLLLAEWHSTGHIDLASFWLRRARRLLPALLLVIVAALAFSLAFLPHEVAGLRADALAAFAYVSNWFFVLEERSYFEEVGRPSLLRHLWSLAVEEQFYVLWPLAFAGAMRLWRPRTVLAAIIALAALSSALMAMLYQPGSDPSRVYYGTDTRAAGLLIGAALAFVWVPGRLPAAAARARGALVDAAGVLMLVALTTVVLTVDEFSPLLYRGGFALVALTTAALIAATVHPGARLGRALGARPLRWVGVRSYGIYLWHWPVFMLTRPQLDVPLDGPALLALRLALTLALAELSYRCVETPLRAGALERAWQNVRRATRSRGRLALRPTAVAAGAVLAVGALGCAVAVAQPPATPEYLTLQSIDTVSTPAAAEPPVAPPYIEGTPAPPATATPDPAPPTPSAPPAPPAPPRPQPTPSTPPATPVPAPAPVRPAAAITAVGDSVLLGSAAELQAELGPIGIDAAVGRQVPAVIEVLRAHREAGQLGDIVLLHVGNNGPVTARQFDELMQLLASVDRVLVVNVNVPRPWEAATNAVLAEGVRRYANVRLVDWHAASSRQPALFYDDGIHPRPEGQRLYASLVAAAVAGD